MIKHETTHETLVPDKQRTLAVAPHRAAEDPRQRRLMVVTLVLLLSTLGAVLYWDRSFWFPDTQEADFEQANEPVKARPAPTQQAVASTTPTTAPVVAKPHGNASSHMKTPAPPPPPAAAPQAATTTPT